VKPEVKHEVDGRLQRSAQPNCPSRTAVHDPPHMHGETPCVRLQGNWTTLGDAALGGCHDSVAVLILIPIGPSRTACNLIGA
jgi:hypothetical protein